MPFPIIHFFAGYSIYKLSAKSNSDPSWKLLVLCIVLANLADLDFLPGVLSGNALRFHRHSTHSLAACLFVGLFIGGLYWLFRKGSFLRSFLVSFAVYFSHVFLDFFSTDGVPLFWPLSSARFVSPVLLFFGGHSSLHRVHDFRSFFLFFLNPRTLHILFFEMFMVFFILTLVTVVQEYKMKLSLKKSMC